MQASDTEYRTQWTQILKCTNDPKYFIEKYFKVHTPVDGLTNITLNRKQCKMLKAMQKKTFVIDVREERQIGASTVYCGYILWMAIFKNDSSILISSRRFKDAENLRVKINVGYDNLPDYMRIGKSVDNKRSLEFENGSRIVLGNSDPDHLRGWTVNLAILDDFDCYSVDTQKDFYSYGIPYNSKVIRFN